MVHRQRGRVDAILTGIGTVLHDDPLLTARCGTVRRTARRVVIDARLELPMSSKLVHTARDVPVTIFCTEASLARSAERANELRAAGVEIIASSTGEEVALDRVMEVLMQRYSIATVLVEAGAGLLGRLFAQSLVNEAWVFIGPVLLGDEHALPATRGRTVEQLAEGIALELIDQRRRGDDAMLRYAVRS
jgi:diaminohydroxyphosphoribosylaminopyrimidine deaminase/5-amino-6-(5-phosphoribosylamino)uracil reductase